MTDNNKSTEFVTTSPEHESARQGALPVIAGFDVKGIHGEGGMATVYLAVDPELDRSVAIKMISPKLSDDSEFRTRFRNEAKIVAKFRHPNIVSVYSSGEVDNRQYIVMEFVDGGTLAEKLRPGGLVKEDAVDIACQMADALSYSHARNIIHRDFKPGNILFTSDDTPVLSDFGVAKSALPEDTALTQVGVVIGSSNYMAPEQRRGETVTDRIDIYSFGVVLYRMLTGALPDRTIVGGTLDEQFYSTLRDLPRKLADLIRRCLDQDPEKRPSAEECVRELQSIRRSMGSDTKYFDAPALRRVSVFVVPAILIVLSGWVLTYFGKLPWMIENTGSALSGSDDATTMIIHNFNVDPPSTSLFIDGVEITGAARLSPGKHSVVAVAADHFGQVVEIDVGAESAETAVRLEGITLPTRNELLRFVSAVDAPRVLVGDLRHVSHPTLRHVLDIKTLSDDGEVDRLVELERRLDLLASYDDQSSVVALYLAAETEYLERETASLLPRLQAAMNSGFGLATFWYAIWLSESLTPDDYLSRNAGYLQYCDTMQLAYDQGLEEIASPYLNQGC